MAVHVIVETEKWVRRRRARDSGTRPGLLGWRPLDCVPFAMNLGSVFPGNGIIIVQNGTEYGTDPHEWIDAFAQVAEKLDQLRPPGSRLDKK